MSEIDYERMAHVFIKMRTAKARIMKEAETECARIAQQMDVLALAMLKSLNDQGITSAKTAEGTVFKHLDTKVSCENWDEFYPWLIENGAVEFLHKRLTKDEIVKYMERNKGELPPGIRIHQTWIANVRES